jgi:glycosyltransferase involved in cell wall biosynthesis
MDQVNSNAFQLSRQPFALDHHTMDPRSTLVIISPGFPSDEKDTTCLPAQQLFIKSLNRIFPELRIIIVALQYPYRRDRYLWFGNTVIALNGKAIPKYLRPWLWIRAYLQLEKIREQSGISGLLSFWCQETALVAKLFAVRKRITHRIWIKGQDARSNNFFVRIIRPAAEELIALSESLAEAFERNHGVKPAYIVPNGIDKSMFSHRKGKKEIDVLGAGSLIPLKQYSVFISVVRELVKIKSDLKVVLIGAGPEEQHLRTEIKKSNLAEHIVMPGEVPHQEVIACMEQAKIFLHPSAYEGYSTVCLEALSAGCHVVSFVAAEKKKIDHWHITDNTAAMVATCTALLSGTSDFTPVLVNTMDDSARKMIAIFTNRLISPD